MGINTGSGGTGSNKRRIRKPVRRIERGQAQSPFRPTENPFPEMLPFRLGTYEVLEIKDDYLVCKGFDPNSKYPFSQYTPSAPQKKIKVAKPPLLQRTPWDGESVEIDSITYTYEYSDAGTRTKTWTDSEGEEQEEEETIEIPYFVGDIVVAVEIRKNDVQDGFEVNETKVKTDDDGIISWVDLNVSGRHWAGPSDCNPQNAIHDYTILGSPTSGTFDLMLTINTVEETLTFNYDDTAGKVATELVTHSNIGAGDVSVTSGPFPDKTIRVEFIGDLKNTPISLPTANWTTLSGGSGVGVICAMAQLGVS